MYKPTYKLYLLNNKGPSRNSYSFYCFFTLLIFIVNTLSILYNVKKINYSIKIYNNLISKNKFKEKQMAKSDLLKEAIADAKAVKETALANAKIALEEAFAPRIHSCIS